ncbi:hypothetical protein DNTS_031627 [Danionella cerebrum]|uniref:C2H2-type domain-containing protein n=1 Tax=Danionella cerebrum TaxID=2873325 RepID=A0A553QVV4_9TELE|nr:hypothetical protein DNTS_031627 [Danionella translucida]
MNSSAVNPWIRRVFGEQCSLCSPVPISWMSAMAQESFQAQLMAMMELVACAAAAEIQRRVEESCAGLKLELGRSRKDIDALKRKCLMMDCELKRARGAARGRRRGGPMLLCSGASRAPPPGAAPIISSLVDDVCRSLFCSSQRPGTDPRSDSEPPAGNGVLLHPHGEALPQTPVLDAPQNTNACFVQTQLFPEPLKADEDCLEVLVKAEEEENSGFHQQRCASVPLTDSDPQLGITLACVAPQAPNTAGVGVRHPDRRTESGEDGWAAAADQPAWHPPASNDNRARWRYNASAEKRYGCSFCEKSFHRTAQLSEHMRRHTGERPFSCSLCGRRFTKHCNLVRHAVVHSGEKPHQCSQCGKRFTQRSKLTSHQRMHAEDPGTPRGPEDKGQENLHLKLQCDSAVPDNRLTADCSVRVPPAVQQPQGCTSGVTPVSLRARRNMSVFELKLKAVIDSAVSEILRLHAEALKLQLSRVSGTPRRLPPSQRCSRPAETGAEHRWRRRTGHPGHTSAVEIHLKRKPDEDPEPNPSSSGENSSPETHGTLHMELETRGDEELETQHEGLQQRSLMEAGEDLMGKTSSKHSSSSESTIAEHGLHPGLLVATESDVNSFVSAVNISFKSEITNLEVCDQSSDPPEGQAKSDSSSEASLLRSFFPSVVKRAKLLDHGIREDMHGTSNPRALGSPHETTAPRSVEHFSQTCEESDSSSCEFINIQHFVSESSRNTPGADQHLLQPDLSSFTSSTSSRFESWTDRSPAGFVQAPVTVLQVKAVTSLQQKTPASISSAAHQSPLLHSAHEKWFICSFCGKSFDRSSHLQIHQRMHTGEKPFRCSTCGRHFSQQSNLRTHQKIHSRGPR